MTSNEKKIMNSHILISKLRDDLYKFCYDKIIPKAPYLKSELELIKSFDIHRIIYIFSNCNLDDLIIGWEKQFGLNRNDFLVEDFDKLLLYLKAIQELSKL